MAQHRIDGNEKCPRRFSKYPSSNNRCLYFVSLLKSESTRRFGMESQREPFLVSHRTAPRQQTNLPTNLLPTINAVAVDQIGLSKCSVCVVEPGHALERCEKFLGLSVDNRAKAVYDLDNCFRCLGRNHLSRDCKKTLRCGSGNCNSTAHHTLIHGASRAAPGNQSRPSGRGRQLQ